MYYISSRHRSASKIELQDSNVSEEQQNAFKKLCNELKDMI